MAHDKSLLTEREAIGSHYLSIQVNAINLPVRCRTAPDRRPLGSCSGPQTLQAIACSPFILFM
jgi:hypothetical protein